MSRKFPEILTGLVVIAVAAVFLVYALGRAQALGGSGYVLKAQFSDIGGLAVGSNVKIGGVTIGHVVDEALDPQTFAAVVKLQIDNDIKLPTDSSATVSSEGLLGGNYVGISPGGATSNLQPGQSFAVTQSAINIENLLGQFIFNMGKAGGGSGGGQEAPGQGVSGQGASGQGGPASGNPAALPGTPGPGAPGSK
jgi:phospholipid/cholesterol/gamma-HCH transport system substrate-binding protein